MRFPGGALAPFALSSARYGGPNGLLLRVQTEIAASGRAPTTVPAPLTTSTRRMTAAAPPTSRLTTGPTATAATGATPSADGNARYRPLRLPNDTFEPLWAVLNRGYLLVYPDEFADTV